MTPTDLAGLCERLRAKKYTREDWHEPYGAIDLPCDADDYGAEAVNCNPDGPEAAAAIESLVAENKRLRRALRSAQSFIADGGLAEMAPGNLIYREVTQALEGALR